MTVTTSDVRRLAATSQILSVVTIATVRSEMMTCGRHPMGTTIVSRALTTGLPFAIVAANMRTCQTGNQWNAIGIAQNAGKTIYFLAPTAGSGLLMTT